MAFVNTNIHVVATDVLSVKVNLSHFEMLILVMEFERLFAGMSNEKINEYKNILNFAQILSKIGVDNHTIKFEEGHKAQ